MTSYIYPKFGYRRSQEQAEGIVKRHPVVVVGAGPVGLTAAIDLAQRAASRSLVLDDDDTALDRLARDLLRQAHAGDLRPPRLRRAAWSRRA